MQKGSVYRTWIDITYEINIGGISTIKQDSGTVTVHVG
jgi:hypothetical protein